VIIPFLYLGLTRLRTEGSFSEFIVATQATHLSRVSAVTVFLIVSFAAVLWAQTTRASLTGRVTDPSKALIVDAKIAAINTGTNFRYETTSNGSGDYYLTNLPPGAYHLEVEKNGFRKLIKPDVILHVQDDVAIDFELSVGSALESVTVESGTALLPTAGTAVSTLVDSRFVENMPLNGRSFGSLIDLTPGVVLVPTNFFEKAQASHLRVHIIPALGTLRLNEISICSSLIDAHGIVV